MSFLGRFFGRRDPAVGTTGAVDPEGWQVGDWAECQAAGGWFRVPGNDPAPGPRPQQITQVTGVRVLRDPTAAGGKVLTLSFAAWPGHFYDAREFRKLRPRADEITPAEEAFTDLVRRPPAPAPAPAPLPEHPKIEEFQ